ncbi:hypothetical protein N9B98_00375 [bacterium]|nr:hypothetical protein [bacterium]
MKWSTTSTGTGRSHKHPPQQCRIIESLITQFSYDGEAGKLVISYKPAAFDLMSTQEVLA